MAEFNPSVPQQEAPNYTSFLWTGRQIPQPKSDESGKIIGEGLGKALEGLVDTADTFVKGSIAHSIHDATDAAQEPFLKAASYLTSGTQPPDTPSDSQHLNIIQGEGESKRASVPEALDNSLQSVGTMHQAYMQKGLPKTYYDMNLMNTASALRARYPGYRDYIDNEFRKVTGEVPANAVMRDIFAQLNEKSTNQQHEYNQTLSDLHGIMKGTDGFSAGAAAQIEKLRKTGDIDAANRWIETMTADRAQQIANRQQVDYVKGQAEVNKMQIEPLINNKINSIVRDTIDTSLGMNGGQTPEGFRKLAQDNVNNPQPTEFWLKAGQQLDMHRTMIVNNIMKAVYEPNIPEKDPLTGKPTGKMLSMADFLGGDQPKIKAMVDARMQAFDEFRKHIAAGDLTSANYVKEALAAQTQDDAYKFNAEGSPLSKTLRTLNVIHNAIPNSKAVQDTMNSMLFSGENIKDTKKTMMDLQGHMATQPDFYQDKGAVKPATEAVDEARKAGVTSPQSWNKLLGTIHMVTNHDADPKLRAGVAYGWFADAGLLDDKRFQQDYRDPETGNWVTQKGGVFAQMTSEKMSKEIKSLGATYSDLPQKQRSWAEDTFKNHFLPNEIARVSQVLEKNDYATLSWNVDHTGLTVIPKAIAKGGGSPLVAGLTAEQQVAETQIAVRRLNVGLHGLMNIAKVQGMDPDKYALSVLADKGVNVHNIMGVDNIIGAPKKEEPITPEGNIKGKEGALEMPVQNMLSSVQNIGGAVSQDAGAMPNAGVLGFASQQPTHTLAAFIKNPAARQQAVESVLKQAADRGVTLPNEQTKLNPRFEKGLTQAITDYKAETGRDVHISSLIRNREQQARAYLNYLHGGGLAAPPGHSRHEIGEAADLNTDTRFRNWLAQKGRISNYSMEFLRGHAGVIDPNHIQLARSQREARQ